MKHFKTETKLKTEQKKLASTTTHQHQNEHVDKTISESEKHLLFDKIKLTDIAKALNAKALKTAKSWCKRKGLVMMKFGTDYYVNLIDFELQLDKPFLDDLRVRYPKNWAEMYHAYKTLDWAKIAGQIINPGMTTKFKVQGNAANDFIKKMRSNG